MGEYQDFTKIHFKKNNNYNENFEDERQSMEFKMITFVKYKVY